MYMFYYEDSKFGGHPRQEFVEALKAEGIPAFISFPVLSKTQFFMENNFMGKIPGYDYKKEKDLPNATKIGEKGVWIPQYTLLGAQKDMEDIAGAVLKIQEAFCQ